MLKHPGLFFFIRAWFFYSCLVFLFVPGFFIRAWFFYPCLVFCEIQQQKCAAQSSVLILLILMQLQSIGGSGCDIAS